MAASSSPDLLPTVPRKSPGGAFVLSLLLPGSGQIYSGKTRRGFWTMVCFTLGCIATVLLTGKADKQSLLLWGMALRITLALYIFSFLDAYLTAREVNDGTDALIPPYENPRVAAVLNLLTRGFGYFYLGQRKKGLVVFLASGALSRAAIQADSAVGSLLVELAFAMLAFDAYRIGRQNLRKLLGVASTGSSEEKAFVTLGLAAEAPPPAAPAFVPAPLVAPGLSATLPLALAGVLVLAYVGLSLLGFVIPIYEVIDQSQATIREEKDKKIYINPKYGVEVGVPANWDFDRSDKAFFVRATTLAGSCQVMLMAEPAFPLISEQVVAERLIEQVLQQNKNFRLAGRKPGRLAGLVGHEISFSAEVQGTEVLQSYVLVRRGLTTYALISSTAAQLADTCGDDLEEIRDRVVISK